MNNFEIQKNLQYLGFYYGANRWKDRMADKKCNQVISRKSMELTVDGIFGEIH